MPAEMAELDQYPTAEDWDRSSSWRFKRGSYEATYSRERRGGQTAHVRIHKSDFGHWRAMLQIRAQLIQADMNDQAAKHGEGRARKV